MPWFREFQQWWVRHRRLGKIRQGLLRCANRPDQIPTVSRELKITESDLRRWLQALRVGVDLPAPRLRVRPTIGVRRRELVSGERKTRAEALVVSSSHSEQVHLTQKGLRLICLVLALPIAQEDPDHTLNFIVRLTQAVSYKNGEAIQALTAAINQAQRLSSVLAMEESVTSQPNHTVSALMRESESFLKPCVDHFQRSHTELSTNFPSLDRVTVEPLEQNQLFIKTTEAISITEVEQLEAGFGEPPDSLFEIVREPREESSKDREGESSERMDWEAITPILETIYGDPDLQERIEAALECIESLESAGDGAVNNALGPEDILVLVRNKLSQVSALLADQNKNDRGFIERTLDLTAKYALLPFRYMYWCLPEGDSLGSRVVAGRRLPPDIDLSWNLLTRLALARLPYALKGQGTKFDALRRQQQPSLRKPQVYDGELQVGRHRKPSNEVATVSMLPPAAARWISERISVTRQYANAPSVVERRLALAARNPRTYLEEFAASEFDARDVIRSMKVFLENQLTEVDPELAISLVGSVSQNRGSLTWETCLSLANARTPYLRYVSAEEIPSECDVLVGIQPCEANSLQIGFAVVEQPLSSQFRKLFEVEDLPGRVNILWHLSQYGKVAHDSLTAITAVDIQNQFSLREQELFALISESNFSQG